MSNEMQRHEDHQSQQMSSIGQQQGIAVAETASSFVAAQAKALVEARFTVALRFPRNEDEMRQKLLKECKRPSFAGVAIYRKPIGGKNLEGPSIRFAEAALRMMKNIDIQTPTIYDDRDKRIVRVTVADLESNIAYSLDITIDKTVERRTVKQGQVVVRSRLNSNGDTVHIVEATEDDLLVKQAALISKAIRTNGLRLVPGDLIDEALYTVRQTMENADATDPDAAKNRVYDFFAELGVTQPDLVKWLGHEGKALTPKELGELRIIAQSIKDGETSWKEIMAAKDAGDPVEGKRTTKLADAIKPAMKEEPAPEKLTAQEVHDAIAGATTADMLDQAEASIDMVPKPKQQELRDLATTVRGKFV